MHPVSASVTIDGKKMLHGNHFLEASGDKYSHRPLGPKDENAVWQNHANHPPGHTNYIPTEFTDGRGDTVYLGLL